MDAELFNVGLEARTRVLGEEYVTRALATTDSFNHEFQELVTEYCWGGVWGRSALTDRQRSLNNLCLLAALNRPEEFKTHFRARCATAARSTSCATRSSRSPCTPASRPASRPSAWPARCSTPRASRRSRRRDAAGRRLRRPRQHGRADGEPIVAARLRAGRLRRRRHGRAPARRRRRRRQRRATWPPAPTPCCSACPTAGPPWPWPTPSSPAPGPTGDDGGRPVDRRAGRGRRGRGAARRRSA